MREEGRGTLGEERKGIRKTCSILDDDDDDSAMEK